MDLFPVQRYLERDDKQEVNYEKNMEIFLAKIKERVKLKGLKETEILKPKNGETNDSKRILPPHTPSEIENITTESQVTRKRKKKSSFKIIQSDSKDTSLDLLQEKGSNKSNTEHFEKLESDVNSNEKKLPENVELVNESKMIFPVIGDFKFKKKNKVKRTLPDWLTNPSVVSVDLKNLEVSVNEIHELHPTFIKMLQKNNITHFFPVQAQVIPWLLRWIKRSTFFWPCDICVSAPTGSGKTLAYVLPILQALMGSRTGGIQALIVLPVQDLAAQVTSVFRSFSTGTGLKIHLSIGGISLQQDRAQMLRERSGVGWESLIDILVTTPGRLVEHLYCTPGFSLKQLKYIVIDEADRIVDNMQNNWLQHLEQHLILPGCPLLTLRDFKTVPRRPQKLLFSATLSIDPEKLNKLNLFQPRLFTSVVKATKDKGMKGEFIGKFTTPAELQEHMVMCTQIVKPLVLYQLIIRNKWTHVIVFTSSSRSVHQMCALLNLLAKKTHKKLKVAEISAECSLKKRESVLSDFTVGVIDVLVSTDALARGMDIPGVRYVVSYDMPKFIKAYIHRVGRTGRAGQQGTAVTMVQYTQVGLFQQMLQTAGKQEVVTELTVDEEELRYLEEPYREALKELKTVTKDEGKEKLQKSKCLKRFKSSKMLTKRRKKE